LPKKSNLLCRLGAGYVEWIHDEVVSVVWPSKDPIAAGEYRNQQLLESALGRPFQSAGGQDIRVTAELEDFTVEMDVIRHVRVSGGDLPEKLAAFYESQVTMGRSVRRHPSNSLIEP
jgi:hypothetical protein